uniref:Uncharacterized protein n=1 Tax=Cacopsylla melanoneura TaxID=428564 RepID=A0A8D8T267_9HEMI
MVSLVLFLAIGLFVFSCESNYIPLGEPRSVSLSGLPNLCLNGNTKTCDAFSLQQATLICSYKVVSQKLRVDAVYNVIISRKCMNRTCHVVVGTNHSIDSKMTYGNVECYGDRGEMWIDCKCAAFMYSRPS